MSWFGFNEVGGSGGTGEAVAPREHFSTTGKGFNGHFHSLMPCHLRVRVRHPEVQIQLHATCILPHPPSSRHGGAPDIYASLRGGAQNYQIQDSYVATLPP